jgi:hypothetical protein
MCMACADASYFYGATFGQGNGSILERTDCSGSELKLIDCTFTDYSDKNGHCNHAQDIGVRCCKLYIQLAIILLYTFAIISFIN